jgi:uncharacterized protein
MTPVRLILWCWLSFTLTLANAAAAENSLAWRGWSAEALETARKEKRFVILDLEAVWCHWCHVMEETTYRDPKVVALLKSNYVTIRVDQDANPDLSARYGDWGWPATIIFAPDGTELVKRRGYIAPENMLSLLQAVIDDPTPGPSITSDEDVAPAASPVLSQDMRNALMQQFTSGYDQKNGGWGTLHKYIDADSMDLVLQLAERGEAAATGMAKMTLESAIMLVDPVWGGLYQYSDAADWSSPHYEKIMWYQANGLRQYASAYALFKDPKYRQAADDIYRYMTTRLLSKEGAFFATQDADVDAVLPGKAFYQLSVDARENLGRAPRIDPNLYARENGWAISALVSYANVTGEMQPLQIAEQAAEWIVQNRRGPDGVFYHGADDRGGPFLGDTIAVGNAALDLYAATGQRKWLELARETSAALALFRQSSGGFAASAVAEGSVGELAKPFVALDEQLQAARFAIRAWRYLGDTKLRDLAEHAIKYLASAAIRGSGRNTPGLLIADAEISREPAHITIVGHKDDPAALRLHGAARRFPAMNKRLDWWDKREGNLPNPDVTYPELDQAAAFACSNRLCSLPAFSASELTTAVTNMLRHSRK